MKMIFHYPLPLPLNHMARSASEIRPLRMIASFESLGYQVDFVTGYAPERRACINFIQNNVSNGIKYEFMYSESTTWPTFMPEKQHLTLKPSFDFRFFKYLKQNNVPIGLFYRDIYWLFPEYFKHVPFLKAEIAKLLFRYDLRQYQKHLTKLYLPAIEMVGYIPLVDNNFCRALPPGHSCDKRSTAKSTTGNNLNLLYIGGLGPQYQMHKVFSVLASNQNIYFTLCTRQEEWEAVKHEYANPLPPNIKIIHQSGDGLRALYDKSDIAMLFLHTDEYWKFTAPFKLYEYLGERKPIIASKGALAGRFVEENNIGWCIPYEEHALDSLLCNLIENPDLIREKAMVCDQVSMEHTWIARAKQVAQDLKAN